MNQEIRDLIELSRYYGEKKEYTLAGGGNTSYKTAENIWIKITGRSLSGIDEHGFVMLGRDKVRSAGESKQPSDPVAREKEVIKMLRNAVVKSTVDVVPSKESLLHELIGYKYVVHLHPTIVNTLTCSLRARDKTREIFGYEVMFIDFTDSFGMYHAVREALPEYRRKFGQDPKVIFLENHGVFVSADTTAEVRSIYEQIHTSIKAQLKDEPDIKPLEVRNDITRFLPALRMLLSGKETKILRLRHHSLHTGFYGGEKDFDRTSASITPAITVHGGGKFLYIGKTSSPEEIIGDLKRQLPDFEKANGYLPGIIMVKDYGVIAAAGSPQEAENALDHFDDQLMIISMSETFGGARPLSNDQIRSVRNSAWESLNSTNEPGRVGGKICIVTGAAQGFGEGIARALVAEGGNVIVADLNEEAGRSTTIDLNEQCIKNETVFIKTDVSRAESVESLIQKTVQLFGGLDVYISNAGILRAGGLDEMEPEIFRKMTMVNYEAYYLGAKYASAIMKIQHKYNPSYFADIIQINSKSGLKGSNRNFAYAGGKFGGIGLTQSFALELAPSQIKVNSICPGNFFEGPLWSDPENGLFVQYLRAGKVPGAKTIDDVKRFYESQVPLNRGCRPDDVMKAIYYIIDQKYETGQAIPVTGGQIMLN